MEFRFIKSKLNGGWWLISPYHEEFIEELKSEIAWPDRKWVNENGRKAWWISAAALETALALCRRYGTVIHATSGEASGDPAQSEPRYNGEGGPKVDNPENDVGDWFRGNAERMRREREEARQRQEEAQRRQRAQAEERYRRQRDESRRRDEERRRQNAAWPGSVGSSDPYRVLHLLPSAPLELVTAAYRALAKREHPDRVQDPEAKRAAEERMKEINVAHEKIVKAQGGR